MIAKGGSWSGHERNCCFLNTGQEKFANVSSVSGLDFPDDGRCVAPVDWDGDGDLDLWLSARTGPTLRFMRNNGGHQNHFVAFRLQGETCNRDAIGARVEVRCHGQSSQLMRTLHACDGYLSQTSKTLHFGLGKHAEISAVTVRWPGGDTETFSGVSSDTCFVLRQGAATAERWSPPDRRVDLTPSKLPTTKAQRASRIVMKDRVPAPNLDYETLDGKAGSVAEAIGHPTLVTLWASWCAPCLNELREFAEQEEVLRTDGLQMIALNVETAGADSDSVAFEARRILREEIKFPFAAGFANAELLQKLDACQEVLLELRAASGQLPSSFLLDRFGRMAVIYQGQLTVDRLREDVRLLARKDSHSDVSLPFAGRWINESEQSGSVLVGLAREMRKRGLSEEAFRYGGLAADVFSRRNLSSDDRVELAGMFFESGFALLQGDQPEASVRRLREAVRMRPDWPEARVNLGTALRRLNLDTQALSHFQLAVQMSPQLIQAHFGLGHVYLNLNRAQDAVQHFQAATQIDPGFAEAWHQLGIALARLGYAPQAREQIQRALQLDGNNESARSSLQKLMSGKTP